MATRVEVAFNIPARQLLDMQTAYDAVVAATKEAPTNALPYVAPLLSIKATELEAWAERNIAARSRLAVLLRTLVHSTVVGTTRVDFPGNDDSQRPGWDGFIESERLSPWVPQGVSGWEFGTDRDVKGKADADFDSRVDAVPGTERSNTTFVFVTPRHWPGKAKWISGKRALGRWKDVRAYDSSDLEQWFEQSVAAQAWFANETSRVTDGVRSLDKCWADWANVSTRPLVGKLFEPAVAIAARTIGSLLSRPPGEPIAITADSAEEALAFLAQLFGPFGDPELQGYRDRVLVFDNPGVLPRLAQSNGGFIAVTANRGVERELAPFVQSLHNILIYPRNTSNVEPLVVLEPLGNEVFEESLAEMGFSREEILRYSNESGRSLTVLRRRMATHPAIRSPAWAENHDTARSLITFMLSGAWIATNPADQTALALMAGVDSYESLETECQRLASLNDAPIWSVGTARGVVSKIDILFAVASAITESDLKRFFDIAKLVLGEDDPRLDLPESDRWTAAIFGKSREISSSLRQGMAETLVLLSVYGNQLFKSRIGVDCEAAAVRLVQAILLPVRSRVLEANDRDLTAYAEAAPDAFLSLLEDDIATEHPEVFGLMRSAGNGFLGTCPRTGLLWALESLAWNPRTLSRTVLILARLAEIEIRDNWMNRPIHSLAMIFDARMPQTAANHDTRLAALRLVAQRFPRVAWTLCVNQLKDDDWIGNYSHKPRWRNDAFGFGEPFKTLTPTIAFMRAMEEMVVNWRGGYSREMMCDLVECLENLSDKCQAIVWSLLRSWSSSHASDEDRACVRDELRRSVLYRHGDRSSEEGADATLIAMATTVFDELAPTDAVNQHEWLFREQWIHLPMTELDIEDHDFNAYDKRIADLRVAALREVITAYGVRGLLMLSSRGKTSATIGWLAAQHILSQDELFEFVLDVFNNGTDDDRTTRNELIAGALRAIQGSESGTWLLERARDFLTGSRFVDLALLAPFRRGAWTLLDGFEEPIRDSYWAAVAPNWIQDEPEENREAIERLLRARRPRAAFACARWKIGDEDPELVYRLLLAVAAGGDEIPGQYQLDPHNVQEAFIHIDRNADLSLDQKAVLEFAFLDALANSMNPRVRYGIPNLEKYVEMHPDLFVQGVAWAYKRRDDREDPPEISPPPENRQHFAERGHKLLKALRILPGRNELGELKPEKLAAWIHAVRTGCEQVGRHIVGDVCIGDLLSSVPTGRDGIWPCEEVRDVLETVRSKDILRGMATGRYNSRGAIWRGEGGDQERALARQYQLWAEVLRATHPFLASKLLDRMATTYLDEAEREDTETRVRMRLD